MNYSPKSIQNKTTSAPESSALHRHTHSDPYFYGRTDGEIWNMFRDGHVGAFKYIYMSYFNLIFAYGCRVSKDKELVKDCIQELFIDLRKSSSISETTSIKFYLFRALRWKIYRKLAQSKRYLRGDLDDSIFEIEIVESHETLLIEDQTKSLDKKKIDTAMSNLTKRQKEAMFYYYNQNMNYEEIADIMNLSNVKSARNIIYKAINQIKKFF